MAPLSCAPVNDLYGQTFGQTSEQIAKTMLNNNQVCAEKNLQYQNSVKNNDISTKYNNSEDDTPLPTNMPPRMAWNNSNNTFQKKLGNSFLNRFQTNTEHFSHNDHMIALLQEGIMLLKVVAFILILIFITAITKKN